MQWFVDIFHLKILTLESYINKILSANYQIPKNLSPEWRDLIKRILDTDPRTRITIPEIRDHPWYKIADADEKKGTIVGINKIPVSIFYHITYLFNVKC